MTKTNKCDADVCFGGSGTRCPRVRCELCAISVHVKCADIASALIKPLRETPGFCWLCAKCRTLDNRKQTSTSPTLDLILQRTTSSLTLIGALIDSMKQYCKTTPQTCTRPCCTAPLRPNDVPVLEESAGEIFNEQLDFTAVFQSILGEKRPRTSSVSQTSLSQPDKITKVDVPISQPPETTTTDPYVSGAIASAAAGQTNSISRPQAPPVAVSSSVTLSTDPSPAPPAADAPSATLSADPSPAPPAADPPSATPAANPSALELAVADAIGNLLASTTSITSTITDQGAARAAELAAVLAAPQLSSASAAELAASAATHNASAQLVPAPTTHANSVVAQQAAAQAAKTACAHALKQATALAVQQISQNLANAAKVRAAAQAAERAANEVASTAQKRDTNTSNKPMYTTPTKCKI